MELTSVEFAVGTPKSGRFRIPGGFESAGGRARAQVGTFVGFAMGGKLVYCRRLLMAPFCGVDARMLPVDDRSENGLETALHEVSRKAERYGKMSKVALQPDDVLRQHVLRGLARNLIEYGRPYCPCREVTGEPERDQENICPCRTHLDEIERFGECECGLYVADNDTD